MSVENKKNSRTVRAEQATQEAKAMKSPVYDGEISVQKAPIFVLTAQLATDFSPNPMDDVNQDTQNARFDRAVDILTSSTRS